VVSRVGPGVIWGVYPYYVGVGGTPEPERLISAMAMAVIAVSEREPP
jgi:hypothetical protein